MSAAVSLRSEELQEAKRARAATLKLARTDPACFAEVVLRHDKTGKRITLAPMHEEWHDLMSAEKRLIIWSHVEGGKTTQAIGRMAFEIGRNPNGRFAVVGIAQGAASKIVRAVTRYIESPQYRAVFPRIRRGPTWTTTEIVVQRPVMSKDPTLQAIGVRGHPIGARLDGILLDDVLDHQSTRTPEQRRETITWYLSEIVGRLTEDAFVWVIGNAYYSDDLLHELARKYGFRWRRYPVANDNGTPFFPQEWTPERIRAKEEELGGKGSTEAKRQLYCVARSEENARVKQEWIDNCLARGEGIPLSDRIRPAELAALERGGVPATTHTGVDIGVGKKRKHAKTVLWTVLRYPDGDLQLVGLKAGRWGASEIVAMVLGEQERFCSTVAVESNGAQKFLLDNAYEADPGSELFVLPHHTGSNKHHPVIGVESVFADLARSRMIIPSERARGSADGRLVGATEEIREAIGDLLDYTPDSHTSDFIMAAWFARENARLLHVGHDVPTVGVQVLGAAEPEEEARGEDVDDELEAWTPILKRRRLREPRD